MELPQEFLERMQSMLGEEYDDFMKTYEEPRRFGLRVNTLKVSAEEFERRADRWVSQAENGSEADSCKVYGEDAYPFHLKQIPWVNTGFYYEREDDPARHPFYHAGLYYLQEPSAMTPAHVLPVEPGEHVLDLCAAPGGKATALAAKLQGKGLLVANDISASRAKALLKNLEVFGVKNSFVTNAVPAKLAEQFEESFDKILVDAPCSGEGMFRKDIANAKVWSLEKVEDCAKIQRDITQQAVKMLRPGGLMLYSTCTFSVEENEGTIAYLLSTCPDMELVDIPWQEGFSCGKPELLESLKKNLGAEFAQRNELGEKLELLQSGYHSEAAQDMWQAGVFEGYEAAGVPGNAEEADQKCMEDFVNLQDEEGSLAEKWSVLKKCVRIFPHHMNGEGHFLALLKKRGELPGVHKKVVRKGGRPSKEDEKVLQEFMKDVSMDWSMEQIEVYKGQAYFIPSPPDIRGKIPFLRNGLYLGEIKKGRFEPSQSFAVALKGCDSSWDIQNGVPEESEVAGEYSSILNFHWSDERVRRYLCGETIEVDDKHPARNKGWQLVCVNGYPLGWGKLVNGTLKNKYHPGWRMQV